MLSRILRYYLAILAGLVLGFPLLASAQSIGGLGGISGDAFAVSMAPQYPAPFGTATLSFLSNSLDLANAILVVSVGGKKTYQGAVQTVPVTLGRAGSVTNVTATISTGGANYSQTLYIQPQEVALVIEPVSSAPPLYPGKSLVPIGGDVRVVAIANMRSASGAVLNPAALSYAWAVDDTQIANSSGIGRTTILVASPLQYRSRSVSVAVTSQDGSLVGGASLSLMAEQPSVRIYRNDPLLGILYDHALSKNYTITDVESSLYAAAFSFPTTSGVPSLQWFLNGSAAQTGNSITLRPTGSGQGSASLSLVASSGGYTTASENLSLSFGAAPSSGFFGL